MLEQITVTLDEREARALMLASVSVRSQTLVERGLTTDDWQSGRQKLRAALHQTPSGEECGRCGGTGEQEVKASAEAAHPHDQEAPHAR